MERAEAIRMIENLYAGLKYEPVKKGDYSKILSALQYARTALKNKPSVKEIYKVIRERIPIYLFFEGYKLKWWHRSKPAITKKELQPIAEAIHALFNKEKE